MTAVEKALSLVGQGYIYGAKGQTCSRAFREQQAAQYPEQAENILGTGAKWDGVPVWDCAQLTRAVAKAGGASLVSGATSQWNKTDWKETGTIDTIPDGKTVFVYRRQTGSSTVMQHTGVALGDGTCVHARGTAYGVVRQNMGQYAWTHWAIPQGWDGAEEAKTVGNAKIYNIPQNETVNLRSLPSTGSSVVMRVPYGAAVQAGDDKDGWRTVAYAGKSGYMMSKYIMIDGDAAEPAEDSQKTPPAGEDAVTITLPRDAAVALYLALSEVVS